MGNITLNSIFDGLHTIVVYANDTAGNMGKSDTIFFKTDSLTPSPTVSPNQRNFQPENYTPIIVAANLTVITVAVVAAVYLKKRK
jgi:hypothetical protein